MTLIWIPLIPLMVKIVMKIIPAPKKAVFHPDRPIILDDKMINQPVAALQLIAREVVHCSKIAEEMLSELSGKTHEVFTGLCVYNCKDGTAVSRAEVTHVTFRVLTDSEIKAYVKTREPMDKAGAYGIQKRGALFIEKIEGDFFNVVGLPLCSLASALKSEFSIDIIG